MIKKSHFIAIGAFLAATQLASSSPIENEAQLLLVARVDGLQSKMDQLASQLEEEKLLRANLESLNAELERKFHKLATENTKQNELFEVKIEQLMAQNVQQDEEIRQLKNKIKKDTAADIIQTESSHEKRSRVINDVQADDLTPRLPPSSCRQLSTIGHYLDGIYLVANSDTNKIETVYCDFGSSTLSETLFGSVDVKTESVHFYVQRTADFGLNNAVIPFDTVRLNVGAAMNPATGVFTVPVNGIYHFESVGMREHTDPAWLHIQLQVNGGGISSSLAHDNSDQFRSLSGISASLRLKTGDQVRLFKTSGTLYDDGNHYTQFTGWLVEEDLVF